MTIDNASFRDRLTWWIIALTIGLIGALAMMLYNITQQRIDQAVSDTKALGANQERIQAVLGNVVEEHKITQKQVTELAIESARRTTYIDKIDTLTKLHESLNDRLMILEQVTLLRQTNDKNASP